MGFINIGNRHVSVRHIRAYETCPEDQGESDIDRIRVSRVWIEGEAEPVSVTALVYAGRIEQRGPVVPAAPGSVALSYSWTETGYKIERSPILARRIIHSFWNPWAQPVTFNPLRTRPGRPGALPEQVEAARAHLAAGMAIGKTAKATGLGVGTVHRRARVMRGTAPTLTRPGA